MTHGPTSRTSSGRRRDVRRRGDRRPAFPARLFGALSDLADPAALTAGSAREHAVTRGHPFGGERESLLGRAARLWYESPVSSRGKRESLLSDEAGPTGPDELARSSRFPGIRSGSIRSPEDRVATNVLIVGAGGAGLRAAIELTEQGVQVLCIAKRPSYDAHTVLAQGGINAALATMDPEDTWQAHAADTLREGYWLNEPELVETLAREAPSAIHELLRWGANLARDENGKVLQRFFGAHRHRRTCYAGDYTGREVHRTLLRRTRQLRVPLDDRLYVTRLLIHDGRVFGAYGFNMDDGRRVVVNADAVILAAGGHMRVYRRCSSRRDENNGDAMRLALDAGCRLRDMELVQFHPSGMVHPEDAAGQLVSEAVRGEGGILRNADGERYMERYDPQRMELSTRDRVALANYTEIIEGRGTERGAVYLDVSHLGREEILRKLPQVYRNFIDLAMLDISREPMEVAPTAHYSMGGVLVHGAEHSTDVEGLFAIGECAGGLHGANRLGGNSLSDCLVFGKIVGAAAAELTRGAQAPIRDHAAIRAAGDEIDEVVARSGDEFPRSVQRAVRDTMNESCGVVRAQAGLEEGLRRLDEIEQREREIQILPDIAGFEDLVYSFDLRSMIVSARATLLCALERRETRGAHNRSDHAELDPEYQVNLVYSADGTIERAEIPPASAEVIKLTLEEDLQVAGRLVE
jgi:succinate dehydrogenase / fumarate reductase flavoprotein subunit